MRQATGRHCSLIAVKWRPLLVPCSPPHLDRGCGRPCTEWWHNHRRGALLCCACGARSEALLPRMSVAQFKLAFQESHVSVNRDNDARGGARSSGANDHPAITATPAAGVGPASGGQAAKRPNAEYPMPVNPDGADQPAQVLKRSRKPSAREDQLPPPQTVPPPSPPPPSLDASQISLHIQDQVRL